MGKCQHLRTPADLLEIQVCRFEMANLAGPVLRGSQVRKPPLCCCFAVAGEEGGIGHLSGIVPRAIHGSGVCKILNANLCKYNFNGTVSIFLIWPVPQVTLSRGPPPLPNHIPAHPTSCHGPPPPADGLAAEPGVGRATLSAAPPGLEPAAGSSAGRFLLSAGGGASDAVAAAAAAATGAGAGAAARAGGAAAAG